MGRRAQEGRGDRPTGPSPLQPLGHTPVVLSTPAKQEKNLAGCSPRFDKLSVRQVCRTAAVPASVSPAQCSIGVFFVDVKTSEAELLSLASPREAARARRPRQPARDVAVRGAPTQSACGQGAGAWPGAGRECGTRRCRRGFRGDGGECPRSPCRESSGAVAPRSCGGAQRGRLCAAELLLRHGCHVVPRPWSHSLRACGMFSSSLIFAQSPACGEAAPLPHGPATPRRRWLHGCPRPST